MDNIKDQGTHTDNNGEGQNGQKTFTQDEVNKIIQNRMARMKDQAGKEAGADYQNKLQELEAREKRVAAMEILNRNGYDMDLADIINYKDEKDLEGKLLKLEKIYSQKYSAADPKEAGKKQGFFVGSRKPHRQPSGGDPVRKAMGLDH